MSLTTSLLRARSRQLLPWESRIVSSIPSCSSNRVTISVRPSDADRWSGVVPEPGGWIPLGEMARCESSSDTVCATRN
jgi:hypothetical protein